MSIVGCTKEFQEKIASLDESVDKAFEHAEKLRRQILAQAGDKKSCGIVERLYEEAEKYKKTDKTQYDAFRAFADAQHFKRDITLDPGLGSSQISENIAGPILDEARLHEKTNLDYARALYVLFEEAAGRFAGMYGKKSNGPSTPKPEQKRYEHKAQNGF